MPSLARTLPEEQPTQQKAVLALRISTLGLRYAVWAFKAGDVRALDGASFELYAGNHFHCR